MNRGQTRINGELCRGMGTLRRQEEGSTSRMGQIQFRPSTAETHYVFT